MIESPVCAVVPAKEFEVAKRRLATALTHQERQALSEAMLKDVLNSLSCCSYVDQIMLVTRDERAINLAEKYGARVLVDSPEDDVTMAISKAAAKLAGEGCQTMLTVMSDIPLLTTREVELLLKLDRVSSGSILIPSGDGRGTNAVLCSPAHYAHFRFDGRSYRMNENLAASYGTPVRQHHSHDIGLDIDTIEDIERFLQRKSSTVTASFLNSLGYKKGGRTIAN